MTDVREIMRSPLILARSAMSRSVIPSAKYSWFRVAGQILEWQHRDGSNLARQVASLTNAGTLP